VLVPANTLRVASTNRRDLLILVLPHFELTYASPASPSIIDDQTSPDPTVGLVVPGTSPGNFNSAIPEVIILAAILRTWTDTITAIFELP
jgi:hypothetical protein